MTENSIFFFCVIIIFVCHNSSVAALPAISTLLANEAYFVHKPAQVELQLNWSQLSYSKYSGSLLRKAGQPNAQYKKGPYIRYTLKWEDTVYNILEEYKSYWNFVSYVSHGVFSL